MSGEITKVEEEQSEFGKGFLYCIGLFLAHSERFRQDKKVYEQIGHPDEAPEMWFNAASDHLYELDIPESLPTELKAAIAEWQTKCLNWRDNFNPPKATEKDVKWAIEMAKEFLRSIDEFGGIKTVKASWS